MNVHKTCLACAEIRGALFCEGWTYSNVWEDIHGHWDNGGNILGCIDALATVAAKEALAQAWREYHEVPSVSPGGEQP